MYWENLELAWQEAFLQGWIAFCHGSVPIGSVITDQNGIILVKGRNQINEKYFPNYKVAHAETIAVQSLDLQVHHDPGSYIVYACAEPCPMCLGTIVMGNIRTIRVAAKDAWSGATDIAELNSYVKSKNMKITFETGQLGAVQITLQSYFDLKISPERSKPLLDAMSMEYKHSVVLAKELLDIHYFENAIANNLPFSAVFEEICARLTEMDKI
jgi:tRNA(Arg) A34 adenosine deaminase TadA